MNQEKKKLSHATWNPEIKTEIKKGGRKKEKKKIYSRRFKQTQRYLPALKELHLHQLPPGSGDDELNVGEICSWGRGSIGT